jgi:hypothetical protein
MMLGFHNPRTKSLFRWTAVKATTIWTSEPVSDAPDQKNPESGEFARNQREFSDLQTVWRWMQLPANPSLGKIPVNREFCREFWPLSDRQK